MPILIRTYLNAIEQGLESVLELERAGIPPNINEVYYDGDNEETALKSAIRSEKVDLIKYLIEKGADVNQLSRYQSDYTADCNVNNKRDEIIEILISNNFSNWSKMKEHIYRKNWDGLKAELENEENLELKDVGEGTPLLYSAFNGSFDIFKYLYERGANIKAKDTQKTNVLLAASIGNSLEIIKYLVEEIQIDIKEFNEGNIFEDSALLWACTLPNFEMVKYLYEKGFTIRKNKVGISCMSTAVYRGDIDIVKFLYKINPEFINDHSEIGDNLLHNVNSENSLNIVQFLVEHGALHLITEENKSKRTPVYLAASLGFFSIVKYYAEKCSKEVITKSVLCAAVYSRNKELINYIVNDLKISFEYDQKVDDCPMEYACFTGDKEIFHFLVDGLHFDLEKNSAIALGGSCKAGKISLMKYLIEEEGLDPNSIHPLHKLSILNIAVSWGYLNIVKYLVEEKKIEYSMVDRRKGNNVLAFILSNNHFDLFDYFLERNAEEFRLLIFNKETPLLWAIRMKNEKFVKHISSKYPNLIEVKTNLGYSPLLLATQLGFKEIVTVLLQHGASMDVKSRYGESIWFLSLLTDARLFVYLAEKYKLPYNCSELNSFAQFLQLPSKVGDYLKNSKSSISIFNLCKLLCKYMKHSSQPAKITCILIRKYFYPAAPNDNQFLLQLLDDPRAEVRELGIQYLPLNVYNDILITKFMKILFTDVNAMNKVSVIERLPEFFLYHDANIKINQYKKDITKHLQKYLSFNDKFLSNAALVVTKQLPEYLRREILSPKNRDDRLTSQIIAEQNLICLTRTLRISNLAFNENGDAIIKFNSRFVLHINTQPSVSRLYLYCYLFNGNLPTDKQIKLRLYEGLLSGGLVGSMMLGGVGLSKDKILIHSILDTSSVVSTRLRNFELQFRLMVGYWKEWCADIISGKDVPTPNFRPKKEVNYILNPPHLLSKSRRNAEENLDFFGKQVGLPLKFNKFYSVEIGINDTYNIDITWKGNELLFYSVLLEGFPKTNEGKIVLYEELLKDSFLGIKVGGRGGIGVALKEKVVFIHSVLDMSRATRESLFNFLHTHYVPIVEKLRVKYEKIKKDF